MDMKKYIWILSVALLAFTACGSDDGDNTPVKEDTLAKEKVVGLWVADYAEDGTEGDVTWTRVVEGYFFRADGTGYYECYRLNGDAYAGAESVRDVGIVKYLIKGFSVNIIDDAGGTKWALTYADDMLKESDQMVYVRATTEQYTLMDRLYADWQQANSGSGDDGSTIKTDVTDNYTDEPARARR
jgi:hypothetical protein